MIVCVGLPLRRVVLICCNWAEWKNIVALSKDAAVVDGAAYFSRSNASLYKVMMFPLLNCCICACMMRLCSWRVLVCFFTKLHVLYGCM